MIKKIVFIGLGVMGYVQNYSFGITTNTQMIKYIFLFLLINLNACAATLPHELSSKYSNGEPFMKIRFHGAVIIPQEMGIGKPVRELSDLAWDEANQLLYAVNDKGMLYFLKPILEKGMLIDVNILKSIPLLDAKEKKLRWEFIDSEGLTFIPPKESQSGNPELLVSFEQIPRIVRYSLEGTWLGEIALPEDLKYPENYRHNNRMLESVIVHPKFGILTAPERPLEMTDINILKIYAMSGKTWEIPHYHAAKSGITAMEVFEDGSLLILERAFTGLTEPLIISLRRVWINESCENHKAICKIEQLAVLDNSQGWDIDNFEGLTRHHGNFFFMVSDDNNNFFQKTLLTYFEILE